MSGSERLVTIKLPEEAIAHVAAKFTLLFHSDLCSSRNCNYNYFSQLSGYVRPQESVELEFGNLYNFIDIAKIY